MSTVSISRRLRPLRLAFLVTPGSMTHLRRAIEASTCTWGGRYNIVLPAVADSPMQRTFFGDLLRRLTSAAVLPGVARMAHAWLGELTDDLEPGGVEVTDLGVQRKRRSR